jgi:hypothetical protein
MFFVQPKWFKKGDFACFSGLNPPKSSNNPEQVGCNQQDSGCQNHKNGDVTSQNGNLRQLRVILTCEDGI